MHSTRQPGQIAVAVRPERATTVARSRRVTIGVAVCAIATVLAACGSPAVTAGHGSVGVAGMGRQAGASRPSGRGPSSASQAGGSPGRATPACSAADIRVWVDPRSAGVAAGTEFLPLDFTNVSAHSCQLSGFPSVMLASRSGTQLGGTGQADRSLSAQYLILGTGQTAHAWLRLADVMNLPASQCQPVTAAGLHVALPGESTAVFVTDPLTTCHQQVQGTAVLTVEPFRLGKARPGTAG